MGRHVLVWDAPNVDMTLANIIDGKPTAKIRPDLATLGDWLVEAAEPDEPIEACVFVNVAAHAAAPLRGWVMWLLEQGFRVFASVSAVARSNCFSCAIPVDGSTMIL